MLQGESNNGQGRYYSCAFPAMIQAWRSEFGSKLWVGFVQIAGFNMVARHGLILQPTCDRLSWLLWRFPEWLLQARLIQVSQTCATQSLLHCSLLIEL